MISAFGDQFMLALVGWRENRHGQTPGMQSVMNAVLNRVHKNTTTVYLEVTKLDQFSSITAPGDPQLGLYPKQDDPQWEIAQGLAQQGLTGTLEDITGGALNYYALSMAEPPYWAASMTKTVIIAGQQFMR